MFGEFTDADNVADQAPPSQATLLGIPQELRNRIFEYVYDVSDMTSSRVQVELFSTSWGSRKTAVRIPLHQAPPSQNAILLCRQLYIEMSNMQAAAFRQYWSEGTFEIGGDEPRFGDKFYARPNNDLQHVKHYLQHVKHFILNARYQLPTFDIGLHFQAGKWIVSFKIPDSFWPVFGQPPAGSVALGSQRVIGFEDQMRITSSTGAFSYERQSMDPECGLGFTAGDLYDAELVVRKLVFHYGRFEPM